ncbi:MAG TPA: hypothetical protein DD979_01910 [Gammaproteobacteria bacterium]|jgi:flagellar export protein FliJ|nr:hypothetical protein [Gammaproteobacteria bacterium]
MSTQNRLEPLVDIAESREQQDARKLAKITETRNALRAQMTQLMTYRDDYKTSAVLGKSQTRATFTDTQVFLARLNRSIALVEEQLQQAEAQRQVLTQQWEQSRMKTRSLEKVVEMQCDAEFTRRVRVEQKEQDEIAGRMRSAFADFHRSPS